MATIAVRSMSIEQPPDQIEVEEPRMVKLPAGDVSRQAANVAGAVFQLAVTAYASVRISDVVESGPRSPIEPALYAFFIWGVIFTLSLAHAVYQALPANREDPLLRRIGWFTAGAFLCTGLWSVFVPERRTLAALGVFIIAWARLFAAYRGISRAGRDVPDGVRWLVAVPIGIYLGWVTAAIVVSIHSELVLAGILETGSAAEESVAAGLLAVGGVLATGIVTIGKRGPAHAYVAYGGTVLWALTGVAVNQWGIKPVTAVAACLAAVPIIVALVRGLPYSLPPRNSPSRPVRSATG
jgi:hypothetical protein